MKEVNVAAMRVDAVQQTFPLAGTFSISRDSKTETRVVTVAISQGAHTGVAECVPYARNSRQACVGTDRNTRTKARGDGLHLEPRYTGRYGPGRR